MFAVLKMPARTWACSSFRKPPGVSKARSLECLVCGTIRGGIGFFPFEEEIAAMEAAFENINEKINGDRREVIKPVRAAAAVVMKQK